MTDLSLLIAFVAVAQTGSFTRASEKLHISQSSISRSISRLEDEMGVVLLERTTRKLSLTAAGQALFEGTAANLDRLAVAVEDACRVGRGAQARLRVGICSSIFADAGTIQRGLMAFRQAWPQIELTVSSIISLDQPAALRASSIDVGFLQLDKTECADLRWQLLSRSVLQVAVPTAWKLNSERIGLEDLGDRPWLLPNPEHASIAYERALGMFRSAGINPSITGFVDNAMTAKIMLACGLGATMAPSDGAQRTFDGYELITLEINGQETTVETAVAWAAASTSGPVSGLVSCISDANPSR